MIDAIPPAARSPALKTVQLRYQPVIVEQLTFARIQ
jgi:hypothetical protein